MEVESLSRKRGLFTDMSEAPSAKAARVTNPEFIAAFRAFDKDGNGHIDLAELRQALQAVKQSVEAGAGKSLLFPRPFHASTCCWLCARFGDGATLSGQQFCELMGYLSTLKSVFEQVDVDRSGTIECAELFRAFRLSGVHVAEGLVQQIGASYDADTNGTLEFDEFVQMRMEWDRYIAIWETAVGGGEAIGLPRLLEVLEEIKRSIEPVGRLLVSQCDVPALTAQRLLFSSMFQVARPFQPQTCQRLMIRFGDGGLQMNFTGFCSMLVFVKDVTAAFCSCDTERSGSLSVDGLRNAFASIGLALPTELVVEIGRSFDQDSSGAIEFDEFLQMVIEWDDMSQKQTLFAAHEVAGRLSATSLQDLLGQVRVVYHVVNNVVQALRPFNLDTCRWLIAKFGAPAPGEQMAQGVTWSEFLHLAHFVKEAFAKFAATDLFEGGAVSAQKLWALFAACGVSFHRQVAEGALRAFDADNSGRLEFDEFLQLLVACASA